MNSPDQSAHNIALQVFCAVDKEKLEVLVMLLNELLPLVSIPTAQHLGAVFVIPDDQREALINEIIKKYDESSKTYISGIHARASAMPVEASTEDGKGLFCIIFLSESMVQEINPKHYHSADLISTLLEELYHVRHYSITWQQRGYIHPHNIDLACKKDLFTLCSNFQDEYVAIRWKVSIMASIPLVEDSDGNKTVVGLRYGLLTAPLLDKAATDLRQIINDAAIKKVSIGDAWNKLTQVVYRKIFEPLARSEAFQAVIPPSEDVPLPPQGASESLFFQQYVEPYWEKIKTQLERSFNNDLEEQDIALNNMVCILEDFLRVMGVTYRKTSSGDCYVLFQYFE
jgi:hypothetical protein